MKDQRQMKFSTRLMWVITPVGLLLGLVEAWRLAGGLITIVLAQILLMTLAAVALIRRMRAESRQ